MISVSNSVLTLYASLFQQYTSGTSRKMPEKIEYKLEME